MVANRMTLEQWRALQVERQRKRIARVATVKLTPQRYEAREDVQSLTLPLVLESRANFRGHTRSRKHVQDIKQQRYTTKIVLSAVARRPKLPCTIRLVRIAPRKLDKDDNLNMAFKSVRDGICDWLLVDDRDDRIGWDYDQESASTPRTYGCRIEIPA